MKTLHLLFIGLVVLAGIGPGIDTLDAQPPPTEQQTILRTSPSESDYGKFDGHGKLFLQRVYDEDNEVTGWYTTLAYYPRGSEHGVKLHRNIRAMNVFLGAEIRRPKTVRMFFKNYFHWFLVDNLSEYGGSTAPSFITRQDVDSGLGSDPDGLGNRQPSAAKMARLKVRMYRYVGMLEPVVNGNEWTMDANVITADGAIEHWLFKGRMAPLQIDSFLFEPKEPAKTFYPVRLFH